MARYALTLELEQGEIDALYVIMSCIGGLPEGPRGVSCKFMEALKTYKSANLKVPEIDCLKDASASLYFENDYKSLYKEE